MSEEEFTDLKRSEDLWINHCEAIHERVGIYAFIPRVNEPSNGLMRPIGFERQSEIIILSDLDDLSINRRNEQ
ncbi:hypothetical protein [Leptospira weilii]|uniref:hypothetical protein n=1 Tax=Leptospira weilii TaxID=28184 RepID=UPI000774C71C|nr:hypothetical protein [Leptospira weilii]